VRLVRVVVVVVSQRLPDHGADGGAHLGSIECISSVRSLRINSRTIITQSKSCH
jgi:hypothetical protein